MIVDVGGISVQELTGRFVAHVRGAGSIEVAKMRDLVLDLLLSGAGSMSLKGRAATGYFCTCTVCAVANAKASKNKHAARLDIALVALAMHKRHGAFSY